MTRDRSLLEQALRRSVTDLARGDLSPTFVAVLDSGIDGTHPDLSGRITRSVAFEADVDGNVTESDHDPGANNDLYGHGTAVASIISRIAPNARFIDVRVLGGNNRGSGEALVAGFAHAVRSEAKMINMSLAAGEKYLGRISSLCEVGYRRGMQIVASRRNMPLVDDGYPAALIPCTGVDNLGAGPEARWHYRAETIEFAAYAVDVPVAAAGGGYTTMTGTSFATPMIAGVVALLLGANPELRPFEIKALLKAMAYHSN